MKLIRRLDLLIIGVLFIGYIYRLLVTIGGNFVFNIDMGRDMLAVREIVVLHNFALIGQTTSIDGLFTGPAWYYLLTIPFILSGGHPYASVILMHIIWFIGGYVLLRMMKKIGPAAFIATAVLWIGSNYLMLASIYAYNPNPVTFLAPVFIYCFARYLTSGEMKFAVLSGFLIAFFWNLEIAFGLFLPVIVLAAILFLKKINLLKKRSFWLGIVLTSFLGVLPQILFELRNNFFMTKNVLAYVTEKKGSSAAFSFEDRSQKSLDVFLEGFRGTFLNQPILINLAIILFAVLIFLVLIKKVKINPFLLVTILMVIVPFIGFSILPLTIQRWHIDGSLASLIVLTGLGVGILENLKIEKRLKKSSQYLAWAFALILSFVTVINLNFGEIFNPSRPSSDPASFKNQIKAIDYVYQQAEGKNFKVYVYTPAVIDLSYQYNFWWYGQNTKYGYLPKDFTYLPSQPEYIKYKSQYSNSKTPTDSNIVFLIKESGHPELEDLWKNSFTKMPLLKTEQVGPFKVEVRSEK